jgi:tetratricopeptide (TPR) repeat protein
MSVIGTRASATVPLARLLLTGVLLALAGLPKQTPPTAGDVSNETVRCELDPPRDVSALEACLVRAPRDVELLLDLGTAYETAGRFENARAIYRRAVEADPRDAGARIQLGEVLRQFGDVEGARREGALAAELRPHDPVVRALVSISPSESSR